MLKRNLILLAAASFCLSSARVIQPAVTGVAQLSELAQDNGHIVTELRRHGRRGRRDLLLPLPENGPLEEPSQRDRREMAPSITAALTEATVAIYDPQSVSSVISSASLVDSFVVAESIQDEPTGGYNPTGPVTFSQPITLPAILESLDDNSWTTIESMTIVEPEPITIDIDIPFTTAVSSMTSNMTSTTTSNSKKSPPMTKQPASPAIHSTSWNSWVAASAITPPVNSVTSSRRLQERQTCSLIFAQINGQWASWCNNWDGSQVISYTTWDTTTILSSVIGAPIPPASVVDPSTTTTTMVSPTSTSTISVAPITAPGSEDVSPVATASANVPGSSVSVSGPTVSSAANHSLSGSPTPKPAAESSSDQMTGVITTSIAMTLSSIVVTPIATITVPSSNAVSSTSAPSSIASASSCGQVGDFVIGFDNMPSYGTGQDHGNSTLSPPIFNPYDHFFWSGGYGYGPPPNEPYIPNSGTELAQYNPADEPQSPQGSSSIMPGSFGDGPRASNNIYWFDIQYAWIGCNNTGSGQPCDFVATAYQYQPAANDSSLGKETLVKTQHYSPPTCATATGCNLTQIYFDGAYFSRLSSLNFYALVDGVETGFYLDTLALNWWNNSCSAGQIRASSK